MEWAIESTRAIGANKSWFRKEIITYRIMAAAMAAVVAALDSNEYEWLHIFLVTDVIAQLLVHFGSFFFSYFR